MSERAMQEATYLILTALAAGNQHGYGIIGDVAQISGDRVRLRAEGGKGEETKKKMPWLASTR